MTDMPRDRKANRAPGYDYARPGMYFVTLCVLDRLPRFGDIVAGEMRLNDVGRLLERWWTELLNRFPSVVSDTMVIMPNHLHALLRLDPPDDGGEGPTLSAVLGWYKTMTTNAYIRGVKTLGWPPFPGHLWQRSFYDHIVRLEDRTDDRRLARIRAYIQNNPANWHADEENPDP